MKKLILLISLCLLCNLHIRFANAQSTETVGRTSNFVTVYNDTLAGVTTAKVLIPYAGHSGWMRVGDYTLFALYFRFDATGVTGVATTDTIEILMEQYVGTAAPTADSVGFLEGTAAGTVPTRESIITFDSANLIDTPRMFVSYHGSGDPELSLTQFVRFYSRVVNGFTGAGLGMEMLLMRQP